MGVAFREWEQGHCFPEVEVDVKCDLHALDATAHRTGCQIFLEVR